MDSIETGSAGSDRLEVEWITGELRRLLPGWILGRRWFAGKDRARVEVEPVLVDVVSRGEPELVQVVVRVPGTRAGSDDWYQLLLGVRSVLPAHLAEAEIGRSAAAGGRVLYDATADPELMGRLLDLLVSERDDGTVEFHRTPGADIPRGLPARVLNGEQSNTSVAFGDRMIFKVLRHLVPGPSPELEMLTALGRAGNVPSAAPLGWMRTAPDSPGGEITLGILQEFIPSRGDGWAIAVEEARACIAGECETISPLGGFTEEARALGRATAEVHAALAGQLGTRSLTVGESEQLVAGLTERLETALAEVPALLPLARQLRGMYRDLAEVARKDGALVTQRVHGDLHLGQVLRAERGWVLIDFEGEPGRPPEERRRLQPALRDVAAMLRSFDYAAHHALAGVLGVPPGEQALGDPRGMRLARRASAWAVHNRRSFCAGYAEAGGADPRCLPVLLRTFEADKAVYEARYEAHSRPEWLAIPLAAVRRLTNWQRNAG
ncbi:MULTISPECIES: phosphotransferase [unclassified Streptomyces]|uniref:maltokinase N-terminal cap-like domain-containing protein n=1 Tax=unclassified Streptomyces TaxID=2593676 RepID=UPI001BEA8A02|nr:MULTISPECIES: phosphotransferase [unclassified Streptomyces]MBT2405517.1 phosphotransferase [Streptomyces sp. ISL-21]MBT2607804.1 phosphotransferase [Streptomyces sp. ISL-87]